MKTTTNVVYAFIIVVLFCIGGLVALSGLNLPGNYKLYVVQSGSMEPTIHTGSLVAVKPQSSYHKGDIITVKDTKYSTVTHRITGVQGKGTASTVITKGDANKAADPDPRLAVNIIGKEFLTIPYAGFVLNYAKTKNGLLFLIIIPCVILIYNELLSIKNEALKLIHQRKKKLTPVEKVELEIGEEEIRAEKGLGHLLKRIAHGFKS